MYEHPYLIQRVAEIEREQLELQAERRRFIREHADQIVARPAGAFTRLLRRFTGRAARTGGRAAASPQTESTPSRRGAVPCSEPATAR